MPTFNAYINFDGNCAEAMDFYKDCFGGEVEVMLVRDTPMAGQLPPEAQDQILHATLDTGSSKIMGSDMLMGEFNRGNANGMTANCDSEEQIQSYYDKLSVGGTITMELQESFWAAKFAMVTDKYEVSWMLNLDKPQS